MALVKSEIIQYIGVKDLKPEEQALVSKLSSEYYEKIKQGLNNRTSLVVHVKVHQKEGAKAKFAIHSRVIAPTHVLESCKAHDWDLARSLHKSFKDLEKQIEHKFRTLDQRPGKGHAKHPRMKRARAESDLRGF